MFRCVPALMIQRWSYTKLNLGKGGHGNFALWFEKIHLKGDWRNWGYLASGVPGVCTNGNPIESWHYWLKSLAFIDTNREMDWKIFGKTIPQMLAWCSVACIGVSLSPDPNKPIPTPTLQKARRLLDSREVNMLSDCSREGACRSGAFDRGECFYFNTSLTWDSHITLQRTMAFDDYEGGNAEFSSAEDIDAAARSLHR